MRLWVIIGFVLGGVASAYQAEARQLSPAQAQSMMAAIQSLNHCRISEAKKIDDGSFPVRVIAERVAPKCGREKEAARRSLAGVDIGANAAEVDDIDGVELAVRQERSPDSNILGPR